MAGRKRVAANTGSPSHKLTARSIVLALHSSHAITTRLQDIITSFVSRHSSTIATGLVSASNAFINQERSDPLYYLTAEFESDGRLVGVLVFQKSTERIKSVVVSEMQRNSGIASCLVQNAVYMLGTDHNVQQVCVHNSVGSSGRAMAQVLRHNSFQRQNGGGQWVYDFAAMQHKLPRLAMTHTIYASHQSNIVNAFQAEVEMRLAYQKQQHREHVQAHDRQQQWCQPRNWQWEQQAQQQQQQSGPLFVIARAIIQCCPYGTILLLDAARRP